MLATGRSWSIDLHICHQVPGVVLDIAKAEDFLSHGMGYLIHEKLFYKKGGKLFPLLAETVVSAPDHLSFTVTLKKNITIHATPFWKPTRTLNADDVVWSFERQKDKKEFVEYNRMLDPYLKSLVKENELTLKFVLKKPNPEFLLLLTDVASSIYSKEYHDYLAGLKRMDVMEKYPVGTGPLQFKKHDKGVLELTAYPKYHGKAEITSLILSQANDEAELTAWVNQKKCDMVLLPPLHLLKSFLLNTDYQQISGPLNCMLYLNFNTRKAPFNSKESREAVYYGLSKDRIVNDVFYGQGEKAMNLLAPSLLRLRTMVDPVKDAATSKTKLRNSGATDAVISVVIPNEQKCYLPYPRKLADLIKNEMGKISLTTKIVRVELDEVLNRARTGNYHMMVLGWIEDKQDPMWPLKELSCDSRTMGDNFTGWCSPNELEPLINQMSQLPPSMKTDMKMKELQEQAALIYRRDLPVIPLVNTGHTIMVKKNKWALIKRTPLSKSLLEGYE